MLGSRLGESTLEFERSRFKRICITPSPHSSSICIHTFIIDTAKIPVYYFHTYSLQERFPLSLTTFEDVDLPIQLLVGISIQLISGKHTVKQITTASRFP